MLLNLYRQSPKLSYQSINKCRSRTIATEVSQLRRSYLYVPSSSDRMLEKSLSTTSDMIIYDLEDSVSPIPRDKENARTRLIDFLHSERKLPGVHRLSVRVNSVDTPFFEQDIAKIASSPAVGTIILPKVTCVEDLHHAARGIQNAHQKRRETPLRILASIESARALLNIGSIAGWTSKSGVGGGVLSGLTFAAEDYCADTSIIRTPSRRELLYTRSQIVITAKAFGLEAIDMVCVNYKDADYLRDECRDGRQLGFTGKQAIHPAQIDVIHSTFVPTSEEILRAAKILHKMDLAHSSAIGAVGLEGEMIDAPMLKQAEKTIQIAKAARLEIPRID